MTDFRFLTAMVVLASVWLAPQSAAQSAARAVPEDAALFERIHPAWRDFEPEWRPEPCPFQSAAMDANRAECGRVFVPEDRRDPDSRLIGLFVAHLKANREQGVAPTLYLSGGPGSPASSRAAPWIEIRAIVSVTVLAQGDLILPDQRGAGYSQGRFCRQVGPPSRYGRFGDGPDALDYAEALRDCRDAARLSGMAVDAYTSWDNALDMRDIRRALGFGRWNVWGVSYGGELAHMVARTDRAGVRALVFDSPAAPGWGGYPPGLTSSLEALNAACAEQPPCAARYGDLRALARRVVEGFGEDPMIVEGLDWRHAKNGTLTIDRTTAAHAVFYMLYSRSLYPEFPALLEAFERREAALIQGLAEQLISQGWSPQTGSGLMAGAVCSGWPRGRGADAGAGYWAEAMGPNTWSAICEVLGIEPDRLHVPAQTDAPALLIFGDTDPITPPFTADLLSAGLSRVTVTVLPGVGHGVTQDWCGALLVAAFLRDAALPLESCAQTAQAQPFLTDFKPGGGPYRLYDAARSGAPGPALGLGALAAILAGALLAFPGAALARRIDGGVTAKLGRSRWLAVAAAAFALAGLAALGAAMFATLQVSRVLVPAGLTGPWAWSGPLWIAGAFFGAAALFEILRTRKRRAPVGARLGVAVTGAAAIALAAAGFALELA